MSFQECGLWMIAKLDEKKIILPSVVTWKLPDCMRVALDRVTAFGCLSGLMVGLRWTVGSAWTIHSGSRANDGMPFKRKSCVTEKCVQTFRFSWVWWALRFLTWLKSGTLETEKQEKQRKQIKPAWRNYIMSTRLEYIISLGETKVKLERWCPAFQRVPTDMPT